MFVLLTGAQPHYVGRGWLEWQPAETHSIIDVIDESSKTLYCSGSGSIGLSLTITWR